MAAPTPPRAPTSGPSRPLPAPPRKRGRGRRVGAGRRVGGAALRAAGRGGGARVRAREGAWPTARCARGGCPGRLGRGRGRDGGRRGLRGATRCGDPEIRTRGLAEDHAPARGAVVSAGLPGRRVGSGSGPGAQAGPLFLGSARVGARRGRCCWSGGERPAPGPAGEGPCGHFWGEARAEPKAVPAPGAPGGGPGGERAAGRGRGGSAHGDLREEESPLPPRTRR